MRLRPSVVVMSLVGFCAPSVVLAGHPHHGAAMAKKHKEKCDAEGKSCKKGHDCKAAHCKADLQVPAPGEAPAPAPAPGVVPESPAPVPAPEAAPAPAPHE